jgi:hypothetical protein
MYRQDYSVLLMLVLHIILPAQQMSAFTIMHNTRASPSAETYQTATGFESNATATECAARCSEKSKVSKRLHGGAALSHQAHPPPVLYQQTEARYAYATAPTTPA